MSETTPQQAKLSARLKALEHDYNRYSDPEVMLALKASTFDDVADVFGESVIKPEAAPFVVGRMYQAMKPYRDAMATIAEYEKIEAKLAATLDESEPSWDK